MLAVGLFAKAKLMETKWYTTIDLGASFHWLHEGVVSYVNNAGVLDSFGHF